MAKKEKDPKRGAGGAGGAGGASAPAPKLRTVAVITITGCRNWLPADRTLVANWLRAQATWYEAHGATTHKKRLIARYKGTGPKDKRPATTLTMSDVSDNYTPNIATWIRAQADWLISSGATANRRRSMFRYRTTEEGE